MFHENVIQPFLDKLVNNDRNYAFCINEMFYTYSDFAKHISKIRKTLQLANIKNKNIGVFVSNDIETYASIFAIWLEGLTYIPLDPKHPIENTLGIISQTKIDLVLSAIFFPKKNVVKVIDSSSLCFEELNITPKQTPEANLAYIFFTSGSTGKPKGIPISRNNLGSFIHSFLQIGLNIYHYDRCLQSADLTFDVSIQSFLFPLIKGACVYTIPIDQIKFMNIFKIMGSHKITFSVLTPSVLRYLRPYFKEIYIQSMNYCIITAEALSIDLVNKWSHCIPNAEIYNFYGPTEATIYCTYYRYKANDSIKNSNGILSIGKPMKGIKAIVIDENEKIISNTGQKGELCISGNQVTTGYLGIPKKNKKAFIHVNYHNKKKKFYKTGDFCFIDDEGDIFYHGRIDNQIKIHGIRIELGEIEFHAQIYLQSQNVIAINFKNKFGNNEIVLFIEGKAIEKKGLINFLKLKIPNYMIPSRIINIDKFPLNKNDKLDKIVLKKMIGF